MTLSRSSFPALLAAAALGACGPAEADAPQGPMTPLVEFVLPESRTITDWDEFTGRIEPVDTVDVRARVSGFLESIHFEDGQLVEQGQLLFVIDPRPFQAELDAARADLERAAAARDLARSNLEGGRRLLRSSAIAQEDVDVRNTTLAEAEAAVLAAQARVDASALDVDFTQVKAPLAGRVSDHYISVGNLISGGLPQSTLLTTIVTIDPIYCRIEADENTVLGYMRLNAAGRRKSSREFETPVQVGLADERGFPHEGVIDFVDNRLDPGTATLRARARIPNPDGFLTPGMFARVRMSAEGEHEALLIPDKALQSDQTFRFVLVVDDGDVVEARQVTPGALTDDGMREIKSGLTAEDRVIVAGLFLARPGARVSPREAAPSEPARAAGG
jgi:RND family efflux transporter MFP subunit